jgi:hypothetical protein
MKHLLGFSALVAAFAIGAGSAMAFTVQTTNTNLQDKANLRLADPDDLMDSMANQQSSGSSGAVRLGGTTLRFSGSSSGAGAPNSPFLEDPAVRTVPSLQGH